MKMNFSHWDFDLFLFLTLENPYSFVFYIWYTFPLIWDIIFLL